MNNCIFLKFTLLLFCSSCINAQTKNCNQAVWIKRFAKLLPKEVCILQGDYHITQVYERVDVDGDGLKDVIFDWNKISLTDGDTIYVTVYKQNPDSTFSFLKSFNNLYPLYFGSYKLDYIPKDEALKILHKKYNDEYLFINLEFENEFIRITRKGDATSEIIITYKYDRSIGNWKYIKTEDYDFIANTIEPYDLSDKLGPTIDYYTYFIWDEE
jgi:hypothetical protein